MTAPMITAAAVRGQLLDIGERAVKTFAQALLAYFAVGQMDAFHADWGNALSLAAGAAILSVLSSLASLPAGQPGTASVTSAVFPSADLNAYQHSAGYGQHAAPLQPPVLEKDAP